MKVKHIVNGWGNLLRSKLIGVKDHLTIQAAQRKAICKECTLFNGATCSVITGKHVITGEDTLGCGCPIAAKTMAEHDSCPLGKWNAMLNKTVWEYAIALAKYNKVVMHDKNTSSDVVLYNVREDNMFSSLDQSLMIPYTVLAKYADEGRLKTIKLIDGRDVLDYSERAKIFIPTDSFISMLEYNGVEPNTTIIVWVTRVMAEDMSNAKFQQAVDFACQQVFNETKVSINYVVTDTWNDDVKKELDNLNVFYEGSTLCDAFENLDN